MTSKKVVNFRCTEAEYQNLMEYCEATGRSQTDVLREVLRGLKVPQKVATEPPKLGRNET